jgi:hypothetical protein
MAVQVELYFWKMGGWHWQQHVGSLAPDLHEVAA